MSGYSKALRGLSVQSRVMCIFTHTSISPGLLLRQLTSRYAIRAGRNLPDKEFRYLRTGEIEVCVKMHITRDWTERPRRALL